MHKPVSVVLVIRSLGHSLKKAHDTIDRLAAGHLVPVELVIPEGRDVVAELAELNVSARHIGRPDVDIQSVRQALNLTQAEFAIRFGLELDTIQNWEQGRNHPDPAARVLLKVIEQNPQAVDAALAAG